MKRDISSIVEDIRADSRYKRLKKDLSENSLFQLAFASLTKEVETIHKTRNIRYISFKEGKFLEHLVEASLRDVAARSRISEIVVQCTKAKTVLERASEALSDYLILTYGDQIRFAKTKEERSRVIRLAMKPFIMKLNELESLIAVCQVIVQDIDKAGFAMKMIADVQVSVTRPERKM